MRNSSSEIHMAVSPMAARRVAKTNLTLFRQVSDFNSRRHTRFIQNTHSKVTLDVAGLARKGPLRIATSDCTYANPNTDTQHHPLRLYDGLSFVSRPGES